MSGTLDHVMMRVEDLEESLDWYGTHLGYEEKARWEADSFTNVYLGPEGMHDEGAMLELTYNHGDHEYEMGDAWGHIAVRVPEGELEDYYQQLMDEGVEDYRDPESCGGRYAFVKDPDGHEVEIVQRDQGALWSLDHTMIRVEDADEALGFWTRKFEYEHAGRWESDTFANYFMRPAGAADEAMSVELTYNYDGRSYTMGDAWGHLAVRADDLHDLWDHLLTREAEDYRDPASCDDQYAFTTDQDGHEIELLERNEGEPLFPGGD
jgi:lactoylglutathione lyase